MNYLAPTEEFKMLGGILGREMYWSYCISAMLKMIVNNNSKLEMNLVNME